MRVPGEQKWSATPFRTLFVAFTVLIASLLWTVVMPGVVAFRGGVFYKKGIEAKLPTDAQTRLRLFANEQRTRDETINVVTAAIMRTAGAGQGVSLPGLLQLRAELRAANAAVAPPISVLPFHLNPQLLLWPAIYTCLGWIVFVITPVEVTLGEQQLSDYRLWMLVIVLYVVYEWPLWVRNFVLTNEGRTVYAYPNFDIDPGSFVAQEAVIAGFCGLLALMWVQWLRFYEMQSSHNIPVESAVAVALDGEVVNDVSRLFTLWQACSVVLAAGFIFFTTFFWTLVARYHDQRYLLSAINAHLLWKLCTGQSG